MTETETNSAGTREIQIPGGRGLRVLRLGGAAVIAGVALLATTIRLQILSASPSGLRAALWVVGIILAVAGAQSLRGLTVVPPGDAVVVQVFGSYVGTIRTPGLHRVKPWARRQHVSVRIRNCATR